MRYVHRECLYNTDEEILEDSMVTEKLQLLQLHLGAEHAAHRQSNLWLTLVNRYVDEEAWEYFMNNWRLLPTRGLVLGKP